jgi:hypothetical protein
VGRVAAPWLTSLSESRFDGVRDRTFRREDGVSRGRGGGVCGAALLEAGLGWPWLAERMPLVRLRLTLCKDSKRRASTRPGGWSHRLARPAMAPRRAIDAKIADHLIRGMIMVGTDGLCQSRLVQSLVYSHVILRTIEEISRVLPQVLTNDTMRPYGRTVVAACSLRSHQGFEVLCAEVMT